MISSCISRYYPPQSCFSESVKWYKTFICIGCSINQCHIDRTRYLCTGFICLKKFYFNSIFRRRHSSTGIPYLHLNNHIITRWIVLYIRCFNNASYLRYSYFITNHIGNKQSHIVDKPSRKVRRSPTRCRNDKSNLNISCRSCQCRIQIKDFIPPISTIKFFYRDISISRPIRNFLETTIKSKNS